jgi:PAT family beta-lactamase induction signal transducer AmpG
MIMAIILLFGTSIIFFNPREKPRYRETQGVSYFSIVIDVTRNIRSKPQWFLLPLFILFYKAGDGIFGAYTPVFLSKLGFTNIDLSQGNLLGVSFAIIGGFLGGILVTRYGSIPTLKICAILQMLTCMMLVCQNFIGAYKPMIFMVMMMEHLYFGVGGAALYSFLSILSTSKYTASQFAFLCSFGSFSRIFTTWIGGWAADQMSWGYFFACVSLCGFIYLMILNKMERDSW